MKYIILINNLQKINILSDKYQYIKFIFMTDMHSVNDKDILFCITYEKIDMILNYEVYYITDDNDITNILLKYNILNIYYDHIFIMTEKKNKYNNIDIYDIYNKEIKTTGILEPQHTTCLSAWKAERTPQACLPGRQMGRPSLWSPALEPLDPSIRAFGLDLALENQKLIQFYIYAIEKSKKNKYDKILILVNPIFIDNFNSIFINFINNKHNNNIHLFNKEINSIDDICALGIFNLMYDKLLNELYKDNHDNILNILSNSNNIMLSCDYDVILKNNKTFLYNKFIAKNTFIYYSSVYNKFTVQDFIKIYDIQQINISSSLNNHSKYFNNILYNKSVSTLFYGVYREADVQKILKHTGYIYIYWHDNDCNPSYKTRRNIVQKIKKKNNIICHICNNEQTSKYLNENNVKHILLNSDLKLYHKDFNNIFDKVFVISLKKDINKRKLIKKKFHDANIKYEFFNAIDGDKKPHIDEFIKYKKKPYNWKGSHYIERNLKKKILRSSGALGYLKSWENIIIYAIKNKLQQICVFDDDVLIDKEFNIKFNALLNHIGNKWKVINLGSTQYNWSRVIKKKNYYLTPINTDGSFAVCLKYDTYQQLLKSIRLFNCPFDSGPMRDLYKLYKGHCYTAYPAIVIADVNKSSIGNNRDFFLFSEKMQWNLENINYSKYLNVLVSIIIPMYNSEKTIRLSIDSLIKQTYKLIEIIIIDDCSTDDSYNIIQNEYLNKYDNIFLYKTKKNSGCYVTKNIGINKSNGDLIAFQDADDISYYNRIELQVNTILKKNILFCGCNFTRLKDSFNISNYRENIKDQIKKYDFCKSRFGLITLMFKKEIFLKYGLYREDYRHSMDNEYVERLYYKIFNNKPDKYVHILLSKNDKSLNEIYYKINKLLYACCPVTSNNISIIYKRSIREEVRDLYIKEIYLDGTI